MAHVSQLPCDGDGVCMLCRNKPSDEELLTCKTCVTPWHVACLPVPPPTLASTLQWDCPDCSEPSAAAPAPAVLIAADSSESGELLAAIRAIEADASLTERQKAAKRQQLLSGRAGSGDLDGADTENKQKAISGSDVLDLLDGSLNCAFCMQLPDRPVTTPCGHNFCLKCFQKWVGQGKDTCAKCRQTIPRRMASQPRINSTLVAAIRMAKMSKSTVTTGSAKVYYFMHNQNRPDKAFTTERAKKAGKANAASGKIFVTIPRDYFGPISAENDPVRRQGVLVGECWEDRMECRQWGVHFPHVAGIGGQQRCGAQSVALSGGYEDDEDHGEWFLYTGSGGRDLSGNKRTNKAQSFDQKFDSYNEALRVSCRKGYPVRVVRSHKEKRSSYAPVKGVRYDGIYRIEKCWRKVGKQGYLVCRYLFVRCDNDPAPWTSDELGDRPRPLPVIGELKRATDLTERKESPSWDYDEEEACWKWKKPAPLSRIPVDAKDPAGRKRSREATRRTQNMIAKQKLLKEFSCLICCKVMTLPITTPCAHNFCKPCLEGAFAGQTFVRERNKGGRSLRARKNVMKCPSCPADISDFLQNPQVNRELMDVIESLQRKMEENEEASEETSKEESDNSKAKSDVPSGDSSEETSQETTDAATEKLDVASGVTSGLPNPPKGCKPKRSYKRQKVDPGNCSMKTDNEKENEISAVKLSGSENLQANAVNGGAKRSSKRKNVGGSESRTRSRKTQAAAAVDEGNDSPSSPLHVQSDGDFE
ncbi:E3 ubiquitin-protein ligase ORTHRUS 2-like [Malania oleifera]|uniref:E3 ubiquitin-protein ligase ORTHRUS 2-like n=1 Tax=Malania oleifera TaxID=397392 RepID=UPI0025AEB334|nr:E3 ubiquitin-protein ligase ORTHRUS 2-like [Malania oleifera]